MDVPDDSWYSQQWGPTRIGMESVWTSSFDQGSGITIAVIDEGLFYDHPDFAGTTIRTDIDKDFVSNDNDVRPTGNCWFNGESESHGTFVTGVIAATINNNLGIAGTGQFDILPLRALDACGSGNLFNVADAIIYAADQDVDVINLSLGHETWNNITLENAVNYASGYPAEIVVVAASGNDGNSVVSFPAGFDKVISVGATDMNDIKTDYSQYGYTLDLTAPGGSDDSPCNPSQPISFILSTGTDPSQQHGYYCVSGTSFASPLVAAVAGLVKASSPCATDEDIKSHLEQTALDLGASGRDNWYGHGRVQADVALSTPLIPTFPCEGENNPPTADAGSPYTGTEGQAISFDGSGSTDPDGDALTYSWNFGDSNTGTGVSPSHTYATAGSYTVTLTVNDGNGGTDSNFDTVTISVNPVNEVHLEDMTGEGTDKKRWTGTITITAFGEDEKGFFGTTVSGYWGAGTEDSCLTDLDGKCSVSATTKNASLTFNVEDVSGGGAIFNSELNHFGATSLTINRGETGPGPNNPPTADAGEDQIVTDSDNNGNESVTLDGSGSGDTDGTITYEWKDESDTVIGTTDVITPSVPLGTYVYTLTVTDDDGATDSDNVTITVNSGGSSISVHVDSIDMTSAVANGPFWSATATITVHDLSGGLHSGVVVNGDWSGSMNDIDSCVTSESGVCSVTDKTKSNGDAVFTITGLSGAGFNHVGPDHDTSDSIGPPP